MSLKTKANLKRRDFTKEFKLKVLAELDSGMRMAQLARKYQVHPNTILNWRKQSRKYKDRAFAGRGKAYTDESRIAELERMVGRLTMENDLLKKSFATVQPQRLIGQSEYRAQMISLISQQSDQSGQDSMPVLHSCAALEISRATFYRQCEKDLTPDPEEMIIRDHIQRIALE